MKPRGRPKLDADDESVRYTVRLPSKQFDATQQQAKDARVSMSEWIRRMLARAHPPKE